MSAPILWARPPSSYFGLIFKCFDGLGLNPGSEHLRRPKPEVYGFFIRLYPLQSRSSSM